MSNILVFFQTLFPRPYRLLFLFFFQAEDGIRDLVRSRGLGDVYKRQVFGPFVPPCVLLFSSFAAVLGFVTAVAPAGGAMEEARKWAAQMLECSPLALRATKEAIDRGIETDLESGLALERTLFAAMFATKDRAIGMESFVANGPGKAVFEGR